jgi:chaperonin cofactor prefoldin
MNLTPEQEHDVDAAAHRVLELSDRLRRLDKRINTYYVMLDTLESQRKQTKKELRRATKKLRDIDDW